MPNMMIAEIMRMRAQGMTPMAARQQLIQRFPQVRQSSPFMSARDPRELDVIARNTAQSMGLDPQQMLSGIQGLMRGR